MLISFSEKELHSDTLFKEINMLYNQKVVLNILKYIFLVIFYYIFYYIIKNSVFLNF